MISDNELDNDLDKVARASGKQMKKRTHWDCTTGHVDMASVPSPVLRVLDGGRIAESAHSLHRVENRRGSNIDTPDLEEM